MRSIVAIILIAQFAAYGQQQNTPSVPKGTSSSKPPAS